ncbi:hypothetical protein BDW59DRAFT_159595 [Aspergillus cavernicola]|uniref:Enoyl reductase (ER) domain-containing protein n=1 Tax=Aspergillus cavernicola TaxID=176166 RepID=A0ABR4ILB3_9EURO
MSSPNMRAALLSQLGGSEGFKVSTSVPIPIPSKGTVLIKNTVASVNYVDVSDLILGQEAAGVVAAVPEDGSSGHLQVGHRVVWLWQDGYAQYTVVPASQVIKIPAGVSDEDAAGVFLTGITALALITDAHPVQSGQTVLVHAAVGGVGLLLCQVLRNRGVTLIGTAGGPGKCELAKRYGAAHVVDYQDEKDWATKALLVDKVYDGVGKDTWEGSFQAVKAFGKVDFIGNASGPIPPIPVERLAVKNISVMRPALKNYIARAGRMELYGTEALDLVAKGKWVVHKHDRVYSLEDVERAHRDLEGRGTVGKLLIKL